MQKRAGLLDAAVKTLRYAISKAPGKRDHTHASAWYNLGLCYELQAAVRVDIGGIVVRVRAVLRTAGCG